MLTEISRGATESPGSNNIMDISDELRVSFLSAQSIYCMQVYVIGNEFSTVTWQKAKGEEEGGI